MIIIAALGFLTLAGCNNNHHSQVRKFKQTAEKTNRSCPTRMNETITLDSTRYDEKDNAPTLPSASSLLEQKTPSMMKDVLEYLPLSLP